MRRFTLKVLLTALNVENLLWKRGPVQVCIKSDVTINVFCSISNLTFEIVGFGYLV